MQVLVFMILAMLPGADPVAGAVDSALERERQQSVAAMAPAKARLLSVSVQTDTPATATLRREPLLRWSNATAGSIYGEVYAWSVDDRPVAIACIYRWFDPYHDSTVEMVSLSEASVEVAEQGAVMWKSGAHGVKFKAVPEFPAPAATPGRRLSQLRDLARRFSAKLADGRGGDVVTRDLRLLNQPLLRYVSAKNNVVDGAIFAFVESTDPEALLILEAVQDGAELEWQSAVARMNAAGLQIHRGQSLIKTWDRLDYPITDPDGTYRTFNFDPELVKVDLPRATTP